MLKGFPKLIIFRVTRPKERKSSFVNHESASIKLYKNDYTKQEGIYTDKDKEKAFWSGTWNKQAVRELPVPNMDFRPYKLRILATGKDGKRWEDELTYYAGRRIEYVLFDRGTTKYRMLRCKS